MTISMTDLARVERFIRFVDEFTGLWDTLQRTTSVDETKDLVAKAARIIGYALDEKAKLDGTELWEMVCTTSERFESNLNHFRERMREFEHSLKPIGSA